MRRLPVDPYLWAVLLGLALVAGAVAQEAEKPAVDDQKADQAATTQAVKTNESNVYVELEIGQGDEVWGKVVLELYPEKTPLTVKNFLRYVNEGFYDGTVFHRIRENYLIQGGGMNAEFQEKRELHRAIKLEAKTGLSNTRGTVAMARRKIRRSAKAQFYINLADNTELDYTSASEPGYCAFGRVVAGMDVVERISKVEVRVGPFEPTIASQPVKPPIIRKARQLARKPAGDSEKRQP